MKKRFLSVLLVAFMAISFTTMTNAYAIDETETDSADLLYNCDSKMDKLVNVLSSIESAKDSWGLSDVDFCNLRLGNPVHTFVYREETFHENAKIYPISADGQLLFWAVDYEDVITISTQLVEEINHTINWGEPFSIIYDRQGCYVCTNDFCELLIGYDNDLMPVSYSLLPQDSTSFVKNLVLTEMTDDYLLPYSSSAVAYSTNWYNHTLNVPLVDQGDDNAICWAACVACIVNYTKGYSLTAQDVARRVYGFDYNKGNNIYAMPSLLAEYGLSYDPKIVFPSDYRIYINLLEGYPMYSRWYTQSDYMHACVIFGIDTYGGHLSLMDPWGGIRATASFDGYDYNYYSIGLGHWYKLCCAALHVLA